MSKIHIGLAQGRTSFWDPLTRTSLSLERTHADVEYKEIEELDNIVASVLSSTPGLVAYTKIPEEAIERWEDKFKYFFETTETKRVRNLKGEWVDESKNRPLDRSKSLLEKQEGKPEEPTEKPVEKPEEAEEPKEPEEPEVEEKVEARKTTRTQPAPKKAAAPKKTTTTKQKAETKEEPVAQEEKKEELEADKEGK